jgi:hypothetical protein
LAKFSDDLAFVFAFIDKVSDFHGLLLIIPGPPPHPPLPNFSQNSAALTRRASSKGRWAPFKGVALWTEGAGTEYAAFDG